MTPNFRAIAEKILNAHIMADINQQPTILVDRISEALRQVYEQRPKVEIEFPSQDIFCAWVYNGNPSDGDPSPLSCYEWLNANTKIKDVENEKV